MPDFVKCKLSNGETVFINKHTVTTIKPKELQVMIHFVSDEYCVVNNPYHTPEEFVAKFESNNYEI